MYWDVKTVKPLPDFRIYVEIENGRMGIFGLNPYLLSRPRRFSRASERALFQSSRHSIWRGNLAQPAGRMEQGNMALEAAVTEYSQHYSSKGQTFQPEADAAGNE